MKDFNNNTYSIETITNNILTKMSLLNDDDYIFYDLSNSNYVNIDLNSNELNNEKIINKADITMSIKQNLQNMFLDNVIDKMPNKKQINEIVSNINSMFRTFDRDKEKLIRDGKNSYFNDFVRTKLVKHKVEDRINYDQFKNIIETKYKRLNIFVDNVVSYKDIEKRWFWSWWSAEMNEPENIKTTMLLIGEQGSGKSLLIETIIKELYHNSNLAILDNKTIKDNFNSFYLNKAFVLMNEISTMDLKESNQISQDLKRLITDGTIQVRGMFKGAKEYKKTFNLAFASNKNEPLQIENGDRRFSVFGRSQKLMENKNVIDFCEENNETFDIFINETLKELKEVLYILKGLDYDKEVMIKPLMNEIKQSIIDNTNKKEDLLISYLSAKKYAEVALYLRENFDFDDNEIKRIENMLHFGIFDNETLLKIYNTIYSQNNNDKKSNEQKSSAFWNKLLIKSKTITNIRYQNKQIYFKIFEDINVEIKRDILRMILDNDFENLDAIRNNETLNLSKDIIKKEIIIKKQIIKEEEVIIEQEDFKEELRKIANDFIANNFDIKL